MQKDFERYLKLKKTIQDWMVGQATLLDIAGHLNLKSSSLEDLLSWNGLIDTNCRPVYGVEVQDFFNLIFLVWTQANRDVIRRKLLKG